MNIVEITIENRLTFLEFIPEDITDHIGRIFHHGLLALEGNTPRAGMVWELKNMITEEPKESRILWMRAEEETAADALLERYEEIIALDDVKKSWTAGKRRSLKRTAFPQSLRRRMRSRPRLPRSRRPL